MEFHLSAIRQSLRDFSKPWTDAELYKNYKLTDREIEFIESMIRPME